MYWRVSFLFSMIYELNVSFRPYMSYSELTVSFYMIYYTFANGKLILNEHV